MDSKKLVKIRKDKWTSNSLNTFNSIVLASFQKINIEIFSSSSNLLMRKYHNVIKQDLLNNYRGKLLDIGSGNGGDIHKWKHFRKIVCVEPDEEKIKNLKERVSKSDIKNRISIVQNTIQEVQLDETFDVASCFFALNDFTYSNIDKMLNNIKNKIKGTFIILFFDDALVTSNIEGSIIYKRCIDNATNTFNEIIQKSSNTYLLSLLRYAHLKCENIIYIHIPESNLTNHYECGLNSSKKIEIFNKYGFSVINNYSYKQFHFLNSSQTLYSSFLKIIEFCNNK